MPLAGTEKVLAASLFSMIIAEMGTLPNPESMTQLKKLCNGIANAIVPHIVSMAQVTPGSIITAGSPASQVSTSAGTIM
jgi:hypothetical protein